ncbi:MAG TPA: SOS response-associated peptidase [Smithellaceae bacterium]|nr:SOS response-associated peptidase [Smithellaceae bacterium]HRY37124.1 SOS response-associated peptidase [Smithellaceae bacterium]
MCGRFVLMTDLSVMMRNFDVPDTSINFSPSRNVSPGQHIPAVIGSDHGNVLAFYLWGLIPFWAKDPSIGVKLINARAETLTQKPSFKNAFATRRCLIPAEGFYELKKEGNKKIPCCFGLKSGKPFAFAGLYERWITPDKKPLETCTIITTSANDVVAPIHNRMPVIVPKTAQELWLNPESKDASKLLDILKPYPADQMECKIDDFYLL